MRRFLRMQGVVACTTLVFVSASGQPGGMRKILQGERAEQLQEVLGLNDSQAAGIRQVLETSRKAIAATFEVEQEMRFSIYRATKKTWKETEGQILAILDSTQKHHYAGMPKLRLSVRGAQPPGMSDSWMMEPVMMPGDPWGGGSGTGPFHPEGRPQFHNGLPPEAPFSPSRLTFAADRAALLQDRLGLTDVQTSKIESMFRAQGKDICKIQESVLDSLENLHARQVKERREVDSKIMGLLTEEQREHYRKIRSHPLGSPAVEDELLLGVEDDVLLDVEDDVILNVEDEFLLDD